MKITNLHGAPSARVRAAMADEYTGPSPGPGEATISVTSLLVPAQLEHLRRVHGHELTEDVTDSTWRLLGTVAHGFCAAGSDDPDVILAEKRLTAIESGWTVSGQPDVYERNGSALTLWDYKVTSAWSVVFSKSEWGQQLNVLAWLLEKNGYPRPTRLANWLILRDWSRRDAEQSTDYPKRQELALDWPLWERDQVTEFIRRRITAHKAAGQGSVPRCTPEERWASEDKWALVAPGKSRALRVFSSPEEAEAHKTSLGLKVVNVVRRPGTSRRCLAYCPVREFCAQAREAMSSLENP